MIPYGKHCLSEADIAAVVATLRSDWLTQGPAVPRFEAQLAHYCQAREGVAVNSATAALHLACLALGLGRGGRLWTSPITFVASANAALYTGASVDFVDIEPDTGLMSATALAQKLALARRDKQLPTAVMPVHYAGQSCDMRAIAELAAEYGFKIIEDASHALGGGYRGEPVGCCRYADIAVVSFHPVKMITTAEGGMALTNNADYAAAMRLHRSHGVTRDQQLMTAESEGDWYYQQIALGFNYRMSDIAAALGASQLQRLDDFVQRRRQLAAAYAHPLGELPLQPLHIHSGRDSSWHLYPVQLRLEDIGKTRKAVFDQLRARGVGVNVHYIPVHLQPYYRAVGFSRGDFPNAEEFYRRAITLPLFADLGREDQQHVIEQLALVLGR